MGILERLFGATCTECGQRIKGKKFSGAVPSKARASICAACEQKRDEEVVALHRAAERGEVTAIRTILARGVSINSTRSFQETALYLAAKAGKTEVVKLLVERGADPGIEAKSRGEGGYGLFIPGGYPLQAAVRNGHNEVVEALLESGVDPNQRFKGGWRSLHVAAFNNDVTATRLLLSKGASVDSRSDSGQTPLHDAAERGGVELVKLLLDHGADRSIADKNGRRPVHFAAKNPSSEVRTLLDTGSAADKEIAPVDLAGRLLEAVRREKVDEVNALLKAGADPNWKAWRTTPLHHACRFSMLNIVQLLVAHGANPNRADEHGWTALHCAAQRTSGYDYGAKKSITELLLKARADTRVQANGGFTPVDIAREHGHHELADLMTRSLSS